MNVNIRSNKRFNLCDIYLGLTILYNLQDILYPSGVVGQSLLLVKMLWGIIYTIPLMGEFYKLPLVLKASSLLIIMYCLYGLIESLFPRGIYLGDEPLRTIVYIKSALNSFLPIFVFYTFYKRGLLTTRRLEYYTFALLLLFIVIYFHNLAVMRERAFLYNSDREEFTNNAGYSFVFLIPLLFFIHKTVVRYILLGIIACFAVMGMKRGAMLTGFIGIAFFLYCQIHSARNRNTRYLTLFLSFVFVIGAIWYVSYTMSSSEYFLQRLEQTKEGNSSHRDILYHDLLHEINTDTSLIHFFFGRGADSTIIIVDNYAHQDWLELMTNNGLLGIGLGVFFYYSIFRTAYKYRRKLGQTYYSVFLLVGMLTLIPTFFSMIIYQLPISLTLMIGFLTGYAQRKVIPRNTKLLNHNNYKQIQRNTSKIPRTL